MRCWISSLMYMFSTFDSERSNNSLNCCLSKFYRVARNEPSYISVNFFTLSYPVCQLRVDTLDPSGQLIRQWLSRFNLPKRVISNYRGKLSGRHIVFVYVRMCFHIKYCQYRTFIGVHRKSMDYVLNLSVELNCGWVGLTLCRRTSMLRKLLLVMERYSGFSRLK